MSDYLDPNNEELVKDFFIEANMQVDILEQNILVLENDPEDPEAIDEIFRAAHTLKGASATVQMTEIATFTHHLEDVLDEIRSNKLKVDNELVDVLLESIDLVKIMLESRSAGKAYDENTDGITNKLKVYLAGEKGSSQGASVEAPASTDQASESTENDSEFDLSEYELLELKEAAGSAPIYKTLVEFNEDNPMNTVGGIQVFASLKDAGTVLKTNPEFDMLYEDAFYPKVVYYIASKEDEATITEKATITDVTLKVTVSPASSDKSQEKKAEVKEEVVSEKKQASSEKNNINKEISDSNKDGEAQTKKNIQEIKKTGKKSSVLRVDSRRIDDLLNLVSEAVINKATFIQTSNQFMENFNDLRNTELVYRETLKELFDSLPEFVNIIHQGRSVKEVKKEILERFGGLFTLFDSFEGNIKSTIGQFRNTSQNLGRITSDLHEGVLQIRMVPIEQIFSRFPRLVRDLSRSLKKEIKLIIEGQDTELDKSVIEDLLDPLIHCVRNSVDHGVESPEERIGSDKPAEGHIMLRAKNEGNMIIIEIADDGKGISVDSIRQKAVDRGLIHPTKKLSDIEAFNLIFEPGFSTAKKVTNVSGRGVGLDVVRKQIEKLNGSVSVWSELGKGTKFTIKLPLTLAIIQGLLVKVGAEIYVIPITSVIESHRIQDSDIKFIDNYEVFDFREDVVSLLRLNRIFKVDSAEEADHHFVVIVGSGDKKIGLMVDSLIGEEDVVIKPLKDKYTNSPGTAGATILGDGTVSLIIDVSQLLELTMKREIEKRKRRDYAVRK